MPDPLKAHLAFRSNAPRMAEWAARDQVSITALAKRHGWDVHEDSDDIARLVHFRMDRDRPGHVTGSLSFNRRLYNARIHNALGATVRTNQAQLERFIVGLDCSCPHDSENYFPIDGPDQPSDLCAVHRDS